MTAGNHNTKENNIMGRNRRTIRRQREIQQAKTQTITHNNHGVNMNGIDITGTTDTPVIDMTPAPDDTTLVETIVTAEATVIKAADLEGVPFSVQMLDVIKERGLQGVTIDDLYNRFPHIKRSSVTARLSEAKKKGKVMDVGYRVGTSGRTLPVLVAVTP